MMIDVDAVGDQELAKTVDLRLHVFSFFVTGAIVEFEFSDLFLECLDIQFFAFAMSAVRP